MVGINLLFVFLCFNPLPFGDWTKVLPRHLEPIEVTIEDNLYYILEPYIEFIEDELNRNFFKFHLIENEYVECLRNEVNEFCFSNLNDNLHGLTRFRDNNHKGEIDIFINWNKYRYSKIRDKKTKERFILTSLHELLHLYFLGHTETGAI